MEGGCPPWWPDSLKWIFHYFGGFVGFLPPQPMAPSQTGGQNTTADPRGNPRAVGVDAMDMSAFVVASHQLEQILLGLAQYGTALQISDKDIARDMLSAAKNTIVHAANRLPTPGR